MPNTPNELLEQLKSLLSRKRSNEWLSEKLGVSLEEVRELKKELKVEDTGLDFEIDFPRDTLENQGWENSIKNNLDKGTIEISAYYDHPPTPEEVIRDHKINEEEYKLSAFWSKGRSKGFLVSAFFTKKKQEDKLPTIIDSILNNYKSFYIPIKKSEILKNDSFDTKSMVEISLADYHLDKEGFGEKDINLKSKVFKEVLEKLLHRSYSCFNIDEISFIVGNDFFNNDNYQGATTMLTPQDNICSWDQAYEVGFDTLVWCINKLKQFCTTLKVILVQGNHARTKEYYLAHALEVYFKSDKNIIFDREPANRKINAYGSTLIGYHHGDCKIDDLPLILATEFAQEWGKSKFREIHTGDKHFYMEKEIKGVRVKQMPSLTSCDRWHNDKNYVSNIRAGIATVYDFEKGKCAEFEERL